MNSTKFILLAVTLLLSASAYGLVNTARPLPLQLQQTNEIDNAKGCTPYQAYTQFQRRPITPIKPMRHVKPLRPKSLRPPRPIKPGRGGRRR